MPLVDTLVERFPNLDLTHRNTLHRLADQLENDNVPMAIDTSFESKNMKLKYLWEENGNYSHSKRVGPYLLGKVVGKGSFAKVKEAMHSMVGEKVAIKIVDKKSIKDDVYLRKNMRREAAILQILYHPNIIRLYEVMETDNNFYMVLELCTGGPLLNKICREGTLTEATARRYVRQLLSAVDYMHQAGVLHRDLKVENLLLDESGNLKIVDFGLSNFMGISPNGRFRVDLQATQCGSPAYAAPEIIANKRYGAKVDVWSIGVNAFAMLTGTLPFIVEPFNIKVLLKKMVTKEMTQLPNHLSKDCQDFIKYLLQPDPLARPSVRDVLSHHWLAGGQSSSFQARTATPLPNGRLSRMNVDIDILDFIWNTYGIQASHVSNSVICKRADEYSTLYYLLTRKKDREGVRLILGKLNRKSDRVEPEHTYDETEVQEKKKHDGDTAILDEMTALQLVGHKPGSLHFQVTTLDLNKESNTQSQEQTTGDDRPLDTQTHHEKSIKPLDSACDSECSQPIRDVNKNKVEPKPAKTRCHDAFSATKDTGNIQHQYRTAANGCTNKAQYFRQAFTSARTSAIVKRQLERRVSDSKTGPCNKQIRDDKNCAHKLNFNLRFRQYDLGFKGSFKEHFNHSNRKRISKRPGIMIVGHDIMLNLTPRYPSMKPPKKPKHENRNINTCVTVKHHTRSVLSSSQDAKLSKLINDVQIANAHSKCDTVSLNKAQQEAMETFRAPREQKQKYVPPESQTLENTRRVKVPERKSIDIPAKKVEHKIASPSSKPYRKQNRSDNGRWRSHRRKLSMEETLERYRRRIPARSPCMCQPPKDGNIKMEYAWSENHHNFILKSKTNSMMASRGTTHHDPAPLIPPSSRLKPLGAKTTQEITQTV